MNYRSESTALTANNDYSFEGKLRTLVDKIIQWGEMGQDIANNDENKKKQTPVIVISDKFMDEDIIKLGCDLNKRFGNICHRHWAFWMSCCHMDYHHEFINFRCMNKLYADFAERNFRESLSKYFEKPVYFLVDDNISERVNARVQ
jgi:hypothetical protein